MSKRALGNNRPRNGYGREGRNIERALARHNEIMQTLIASGMNKKDASEQALWLMKVCAS